MRIGEVVEMARFGELSSLAVKDDVPAVLSFINLGLIEIYKRFDLLIKEEVITLVEGQTIYNLPEDLRMVEGCFAEDGTEIILNDTDDPLSVMTPSYNTIQVPNPEDGTALSFIYVAYPAYVKELEDDLIIPLGLLEALLAYIGYRAHIITNTTEDDIRSPHYIRFDASCKKAVELGIISPDNVNNYKLNKRGFA